jgi:2-polyprenyl-3-methyl-5-hydroxy-6-metoxy-1,4-benzoquinol methylase
MKYMTVESCLLCGSRQSVPFDQRQFQGITVSNRLCRTCGLVYQTPRMSDAALAEFYEDEYRRLYQGSAGPNPKDLAVQRARAASLVVFARAHLQTVTRHLDIGCSAGLLLQAFRKAYSSQPSGIEPGAAYRTYTQQAGLQVFATLEELKTSSPAPFDLISMAHVLEHLPDPVGYLADLRRGLLAGAGWLLVEVPNLYAHDSFEVAHLASYSAHTLAQTLKKAGYTIVQLEQHGRPRSALLPLYLTVLARPAASSTDQPVPENGVRRKRQWGMLRRRILTRLSPRRAWLPVDAASAGE